MRRRLRARFRWQAVLQVFALVASISALAWTLFASDHMAVPVVIAVLVVLQIAGLIRVVEAHIRTLEEFFAAVDYEDLTRRFIADDVDVELKQAFNRILASFQEARAERDLQAEYLEAIVRHVPVPFIAARPDGTFSLVNNPARRLTGISALHRFDQLAELDPELPALMQHIEPGGRQLLQTRLRDVPAELRVSVAEIRMQDGSERLYTIENLSGELTARESSAWRNLIRVLTHEIMNTLTPVASLAQTAEGMLNNPAAADDVRQAVTTIARRSEGLMNFVARYRELLKVPLPDPEPVNVLSALQSVATLLASEMAGVALRIDVVPDTLTVHADRSLLDQVLLNLARNALEAMQGMPEPKLELLAKLDFGKALIRVRDNGPGIETLPLEDVFIPFFTTKRDGSGIGLSLSRQIMTAHGGDIVLESGASGTTATLIL